MLHKVIAWLTICCKCIYYNLTKAIKKFTFFLKLFLRKVIHSSHLLFKVKRDFPFSLYFSCILQQMSQPLKSNHCLL